MRHTSASRLGICIVGLALMADTCSTQGPQARSFAAGSLVIPMDNCYQKRDAASAPGGQVLHCNVTADEGVFRAYGLVYFLLKHGVPVFWAVDGATPKTSEVGVDVSVAAPASGPVVQQFSWSSGSLVPYSAPGCTTDCSFQPGEGINYIGGPFIVDSSDAATALSLFSGNADFAPFKSQAIVDIHEVQNSFTAKQVRPLSGPPPKLAILNITPPAGKKTAANVMYQYAVAAGLSWPCQGNGDCAGGLGPSCSLSAVLAYLANPAGDRDIPQVCTPAGCTVGSSGCLCAPMFNTGANTASDIYDLLCDGDFIPPATGTGYADTQLAQGNYKLLWVPHWDTGAVVPTGSTSSSVVPPIPATAAADKLGWELLDIASFVQAGNNLFVECLGIQALEGITNQTNVNGPLYGIPATRFQTGTGILDWNGPFSSSAEILDVVQPDMQVGDFQYSLVTGAIQTYYPNGTEQPAQAYLNGVDRLITQPATTTTANPPYWDVSSTYQTQSSEAGAGGAVAYLGGHDYSPSVDGVVAGQTAGTRIVLNTLFNLGFACVDPNTPCNTGLLGVCATGVLKCSSGGGLVCVQTVFPSPEVCNGLDDNCNGLVDEGGVCNAPICTEGATRPCYDGPAGTEGVGPCQAGTETCTNGVWGACRGEVVPQPEVCNGIDDNCNGQVDEGSLCPVGDACANGVCVPSSCGVEAAPCPIGYTCTTTGCLAIPCPTATCPAGQVCQGSSCTSPCANVTCGSGSTCSGGACMSGSCYVVGCPNNEVCFSNQCVADPCAGVTCPEGTFCRPDDCVGGTCQADCVRSCAYVACPSGQTCGVDGFCSATAPCSPACGTGTLCQNGTCVTDPCAGVLCGLDQVCQGGACVDDPCNLVSCGVGACTGGQCHGGVTPSSGTARAPQSASTSGGCSSLGGTDLLGLGFTAFAFLPRLRRRRRAAPRRKAGALPLAVALAAALVLTACGKSSASGCPSAQLNCGSGCVDPTSDSANCGSCGIACNTSQGFACQQSACVFPTGNPFLASVSPANLSPGRIVTFTLAGSDFQPGAQARFTGAGVSALGALSISSLASAAVTVDLTAATVGTMQVRVLNPSSGGAPLASNAVPVSLNAGLVLLNLSPAGVLQSVASPLTLSLSGVGFTPDMVASLSLAGGTSTHTLPTTVASSTAATAVIASPAALGIGTYSLTVSNAAGNTSTLAFQVNPGAPVVQSLSTTCVNVGSYVSASATGQFFYPSSVAHVSGPGISNSVLPTACQLGNLVLGQCANGTLDITVDLTGQTAIQPGSYTLTIVNPGPLSSASTTITVQAATNPCP